MPDVEVHIEGLKELEEKLQAMKTKIARSGIREALTAAAEPMRAEIEHRAPVSDRPDATPGFLRSHIKFKITVRTDALYGRASVLPSNDEYPRRGTRLRNVKQNAKHGLPPDVGRTVSAWTVAYWLEYGTSKMGARPFIRPSFEAMVETALAKITETLKSFVEGKA